MSVNNLHCQLIKVRKHKKVKQKIKIPIIITEEEILICALAHKERNPTYSNTY